MAQTSKSHTNYEEKAKGLFHTQYRLTTELCDESIVQELVSIRRQQEERLMSWVMHTRDEGIRNSLIALGWTPPA